MDYLLPPSMAGNQPRSKVVTKRVSQLTDGQVDKSLKAPRSRKFSLAASENAIDSEDDLSSSATAVLNEHAEINALSEEDQRLFFDVYRRRT